MPVCVVCGRRPCVGGWLLSWGDGLAIKNSSERGHWPRTWSPVGSLILTKSTVLRGSDFTRAGAALSHSWQAPFTGEASKRGLHHLCYTLINLKSLVFGVFFALLRWQGLRTLVGSLRLQHAACQMSAKLLSCSVWDGVQVSHGQTLSLPPSDILSSEQRADLLALPSLPPLKRPPTWQGRWSLSSVCICDRLAVCP